jgi:methionyl-tRNA formyltransferase
MAEPAIIVFAYSEVGHACLKFLLDRKENVVAVYTHENIPDEKPWFPSVKALAQDYHVPVRTVDALSSPEELQILRMFNPQIIFSFYYRRMIPAAVLALPELGAYNMHGSFLPKYRGRSPVNWAVLNGETVTGATLHLMVEKPDAGDIIDQEPVLIGPDDTALVVQRRVTMAAVQVLERQIDKIKRRDTDRRAQDPSKASYFGGRKPEDGKIDWSKSAKEIHNLVRAVTHPFPGAFADVGGVKTYIWESRLTNRSKPEEKPGSTLIAGEEIFVVCGDGELLNLLRMQRDGDIEVSGSDIVRRLNQ